MRLNDPSEFTDLNIRLTLRAVMCDMDGRHPTSVSPETLVLRQVLEGEIVRRFLVQEES